MAEPYGREGLPLEEARREILAALAPLGRVETLPLAACLGRVSAEPLLAPGPGRRWALLLSSSDSRYGGTGACFPDGTSKILLPGRTTLALRAEPAGT